MQDITHLFNDREMKATPLGTPQLLVLELETENGNGIDFVANPFIEIPVAIERLKLEKAPGAIAYATGSSSHYWSRGKNGTLRLTAAIQFYSDYKGRNSSQS